MEVSLYWSVQIAATFAGAYVIVLFYRTAFRCRSIGELSQALRAAFWSGETVERLAALPLLVLLTTLMFDAFTAWKQAITGYTWDPLFAEIDRVLAFGVDPWRISHGLFGWATPIIDWWYIWAWWAVKLGLLCSIITWDRLERRARYYTAHVLLWTVAGSVLADVFASGGPVFYEGLTGDGRRFAGVFTDGTPRFDNLRTLLWQGYTGELPPQFFGGISAMPSLHVGASALAALWGWSVGRWPGLLLTVWALITFVGSVHLGWHYAIDGYAGALVAAGAWWVAGRVV